MVINATDQLGSEQLINYIFVTKKCDFQVVSLNFGATYPI